MINHRKIFRDLLIPGTIHHAIKNVTGYQELYHDIDLSSITGASIDTLPVLTKNLVLKNQGKFLDQSLESGIIQHTKGTTSSPFYIYRSKDELSYINNFFSKLLGESDSDNTSAPICISLVSNHHGDPITIPYSNKVYQIPLHKTNLSKIDVADNFKHLIELAESFMIVGLESEFRVLTACLIESGFDFNANRPKRIILTGDFLTSRLQKFYEEIWKVNITNRYSLTEAFGGASYCTICNGFHFDPFVYGEVINPFTNKIVKEGYGALLITSLYPFVQMQPFIRYMTGDLVYVQNVDCVVDSLSFIYKGRLSKSVVINESEELIPLLTSAEVYDVLDSFSDILSSKMYTNIKGLSDYSVLGHLIFGVRFSQVNDILKMEVDITLRYPYYKYSERVKKIKSQIRKEILKRHEGLGKLIKNLRAELTIKFSLPNIGTSYMPDEIEYLQN